MLPGCSWVGWLLALLSVAAGKTITRSRKEGEGEGGEFAGAGAVENKKEALWKSDSNAPVAETQ